jgi:glycerol-3-phosphate cytidylyltransferase
MLKPYDIVYTAGTFDLLNVGHINILKRSKELGNILIVGVSTDELVCSYKQYKPVIPYKDRVKLIESCKYVDMVVKQSVLLDIRILKKYKVNCVTIGSDWKNKCVGGLDWMKQHGTVIYLPYTKHISSTVIKREIIQHSYDIIRAELRKEQVYVPGFKI